MKNFGLLSIALAAFVWLAMGANLVPIISANANKDARATTRFDLNFSSGGRVLTDFETADDIAYAAALQPDGKIVAAGYVELNGARAVGFGVARYNSDGSLDTTFDQDGKASILFDGKATAQAVLIQPDGKIIVAGAAEVAVNNVLKYRFAAARLNANGSRDASFGANGIAIASFGDFDQFGNAAVLQPDGRIVLAGHLNTFANGNIQDWAAAQFNADGSLDAGFGTNGKTIINNDYSEELYGAALQADGKIVLAGLSGAQNVSGRLTLNRLNSNGALDASFGASGKVVSPFANSFATSVAIQTDNKIVAAGSLFSGNVDDFDMERYNADGSIDAGFGTNGRVVTAISPQADRANDVVLQPDGKIILSGRAALPGLPAHFAVARYTANGALDTSFSGDGIEVTQIGINSEIWQSLVQPDNKIVAVGTANTNNGTVNPQDFALVRYDADGAGPTPTVSPSITPTVSPTVSPTATPTPTPAGNFDNAFGASGKATTNFNVDAGFGSNDFIYAVAVQSDGKIVAAGASQRNANGALNQFAVARYNQNGTLDAGFGANGKVTTVVGVGNSEARGVAVQTDGKIVVAGNASINSNSSAYAVARYNADGSLDSSFGTNGIVLTDLNANSFIDVVRAMQILPDGKILVAGQAQISSSTGSDFAVARYNTTGTLDTSFGTNGVAQVDFSLGDSASALALQADGKIVLAGRDGFNGAEFAFARLNANGALDTSFGTNGKKSVNLSSNTDEAYAVAVQPDNKIVAAGRVVTGSNQEDFGVVRLAANGALDTSFNSTGSRITSVGTVDSANAIVVQPDGKIVAVGSANTADGYRMALVRYTATGALDSTFGTSGVVVAAFAQTGNASAYAAILQPDGKIVAAGNSLDLNSQNGYDFALARFYAFTPRKVPNDFDADFRTDYVVFRDGVWYVLQSSNNQLLAAQWGVATDKPVPADFDGDGKTDFAVWRASESRFYILNSSNGQSRVEQFGQTGDIPVVADWDNDGKTDVAVYRDGTNANLQSYFYYRPSTSPATDFVQIAWGVAGDKPVSGDFDGDGRADAAIYRASDQVWYIRQSSNNALRTEFWGLASDKRITGDFDGDAKTDIAVWRDGVFYIKNSVDNSIRYQLWGVANDTLALGDFDGDGKTDFAVWRNRVFYVLSNSSAAINYQTWGVASDVAPYSSNP